MSKTRKAAILPCPHHPNKSDRPRWGLAHRIPSCQPQETRSAEGSSEAIARGGGLRITLHPINPNKCERLCRAS
ncbi:hypothetical protein [Brasilonema bromeliae]|uniref:hypothetical protein n=1 Tax=Brasilonema bromeliae TaxID=383615 RepID=UPI00145EC37A|nr:hypothetical protein [Brasilonema bromeliae]